MGELGEEMFFSTIIDSHPKGIIIEDMKGYVLYANPASCRMLGVELSELKGLKLTNSNYKIINKLGMEIAPKQMPASIAARERKHKNEMLIGVVNGNDTNWFVVESFPVYDKVTGNISYVVSEFSLATEYQKAELKFTSLIKNYSEFYNTVDDIFFVLDEKGNILEYNQAVTRKLGYAPDELLGQSVYVVNPPADRENAQKIARKVLSGEIEYSNIPVVAKSGEVLPTETKLFKGTWNGIPAIFGISKDVSKLKKSEEKFEKAFQLNSSLISISLLEDGTFIEVNDSYHRILGYDKHEIIGHTSEELGIFKKDGTRDRIYQTLKDEGNCKDLEITFYTKYGDERTGLFSSATIVIDGKQCILSVVVDITDRKQFEREILDDRERFSALIDKSPAAHYFLEGSTIINCNPAGIQLLGLNSLSEIINKKFTHFSPAKQDNGSSSEDLLHYFVYLALTSGNHRFEWTFSKPNGKTFQSEVLLSSFKNKNTTILHAVVHDISDRKATEKLIINNEAKYREMFETIDDVYYQTTIDGNLLVLSPSVTKVLGYSPDELIGGSILKLYAHPEERATIIQEILTKESLSNYEIYLIKKNGSKIPISLSVRIIHREGNEIVLTGLMRDITIQKEQEQRIIENENQLKAIFNVVGSGIMIIDSESMRIVEINDTAIRMIGTGKDEIVGHICHDFVCPAEKGNCPVKDLKHKVEQSEKILLTASGNKRFIIKTVIPITFNGKDCYLESFMDVTELKENEKELKRLNLELQDSNSLIETNLHQKNMLIQELTETKEKLEKINSEKDKFFSIIAHDLKSPFSGFLGLTRVIAENSQDFTREELHEFGIGIQQSATNLYKLLENLLEWSVLQRDSYRFDPVNVDFHKFVEDVFLAVKDAAWMKRIDLRNTVPAGMEVFADVSMLNSILRNIVTNAVKFTPISGQISVSAEDQENEIIIAVKDSGIGMDEFILRNMFSLSQKISRKGTEGEPSTGLGLILCKEFMDKHEGTIRVESEVGNGSTFFLTFPKRLNKMVL